MKLTLLTLEIEDEKRKRQCPDRERRCHGHRLRRLQSPAFNRSGNMSMNVYRFKYMNLKS